MGKIHPTISVITAVKDNLDGLIWTVGSIKEQTWSRIEHIVIDAASTDGTLEFLKNYTPEYAVNYASEPDSGIYDGMNKGAKKANGDVLLFLNGGDRLASPTVLEHVASDWERTNWDWAIGGMNYVNGEGSVIDRYQPRGNLVAKVPLGLAYYPHPSAFFTTSIYQRLGGYRDGYGWSADQELMIRAAKLASPRIFDENITDFAIGGAHTQGTYHEFFNRYRKIRQDNNLLVVNKDAADWLYTKAISNIWTARSALSDIKKKLLREEMAKF